MTRQHASADRRRAHKAGQEKIKHYCSCVRLFVGNAAWRSHTNANPHHHMISCSDYIELTREDRL